MWRGSSRHTIFPGADHIQIDEQNPSIIQFSFQGLLNGMEKINIFLPTYFRRRPIEMMLFDKWGERTASLLVEEKTKLRTERTYYLDHTIESSENKHFVLKMIFQDGPALQAGVDKEDAFKGLSVTACYKLNLSHALINYHRFKPISGPILFTAFLVLGYAVTAVFILRNILPGNESD